MESKITGGKTELMSSAIVLGKYEVKYYRCIDTGFIQTEDPYWLNEAYSSAITSLDLGLLQRNIHYSEKAEQILLGNFNSDGHFLDYAGGYGIFTRLMRDKGFNFYHTDKYCENLFAKHFELEDAGIAVKFETLTAFELFEHLVHPQEEIEKMLHFSDTILFSTELVPDRKINNTNDWWYFSTETGQHISFYTLKSLKYLASKYECQLYSFGGTVHMLTKKNLKQDPLFAAFGKQAFLPRKLNKFLNAFSPKPRKSLLQDDWAFVKNK